MISRHHRLFPAFWAVIFICLGQSVVGEANPRPIKQIRYVMGTLCEITVYPQQEELPLPLGNGEISGASSGRGIPEPPPPAHTTPKEQANAAVDAAFAELKRIDTVLSNWNADSELMRMNLRAALPGNPRPQVKVSEELFQRLQVAIRIAHETEGVFDPTVAPLVRAWGFLPRCPARAPCRAKTRAEAIAEARRKVGWHKVALDPETKEVQFAVSGMEIDLGGIAKGYAVERAIQVLKEHGIHSALVNLGSSSLKALGQPGWQPGCQRTEGDECLAWSVSVVNPRDRHLVAAKIYLRDGDALATSGTYEHTVGKGNNRRSHLIDPYTGQALGGETSVSVLLSDAEVADALTKPFILRGDLKSDYADNIFRLYPRSSVVVISIRHGQLAQRKAGSRLESHMEDGVRAYSMIRLAQAR